jgi:ligand-binding sensor domain-containing protein
VAILRLSQTWMRPQFRQPARRGGRLVYALLLPALALLVLACSPAVALDPDRKIHQLHHNKWTVNEGVSGQVGAMAQTREGYLWLGAGLSLFRFDGVRFERYVSAAGESFATVSSLLAPASGGLWVGLRLGGAAFISDDHVTRWGDAEGLPAGAVYGFAIDDDGTVWAAANDGLALFDGTHWRQIGDQGSEITR